MGGLRAVRWVVVVVLAGAAVWTTKAQDRVGWYPADKGCYRAGVYAGRGGEAFPGKGDVDDSWERSEVRGLLHAVGVGGVDARWDGERADVMGCAGGRSPGVLE